jgi:hypothetical protein
MKSHGQLTKEMKQVLSFRQNSLWLLGLSAMLVLCGNMAFGQVSGKDFNANGVFNTSTSYNEAGAYTVTGGTLGQIRLEFELPDAFTFASKGATGGTTVLFPSAATQNLAVNYPEDYWDNAGQPTSQLIVPCYVNGAITNAVAINGIGIAQLGNNQKDNLK